MNTIPKIAIIGAMSCEINEIKNYLTDLKENSYQDLKIFTGTIGNKFVILSQSGIGKVNAAINAQYIIDTFHPDMIINTGVAGGLGNGLKIGNIIIAEYLVQHDFDVTFLGYAKGNMCNGKDKTKPTKYYCDKNLTENFEKIINEKMPEIKYYKGVIASGDIFVSDKKRKEEINKTFGAIAVEMEGCAVAQAASRNGVPFIIIRAISDLADGTKDEYRFNLEDIAKLASKTVESFLTI